MSDLQTLVDRQEIADLISRLGLWLDEKRFDKTDDLFTADVAVRTAGGTAEGVERVSAQAARNHTTDTQHVITNVLVDLAGNRATARANLVVTFVEPRRTLGERYRFEAAARRTAGGSPASRSSPCGRPEAPNVPQYALRTRRSSSPARRAASAPPRRGACTPRARTSRSPASGRPAGRLGQSAESRYIAPALGGY